LLHHFEESRFRCVDAHERGFRDREEKEALRESVDRVFALAKLVDLPLFLYI
jgi:two-component sensor histidine kinase